MSAIRIKDKSMVPRAVPGSGFQPGFVYTQPETGASFHSHAWSVLVSKVKAHRMANHIPVGLQFEREVEEGVCNQVPHACEEVTDWGERFTNFKDAMVAWMKAGLPVVSDEEYNSRIGICSGGSEPSKACPFWKGFSNFKVSCRKCGCTGLKLNLQTEKCPLGLW